jgi:hypothetical protein
MTRKDYIAIAEDLNKSIDKQVNAPHLSTEAGIDVHAALTATVQSLCFVFERDNPLFDRGRFIKACGLE